MKIIRSINRMQTIATAVKKNKTIAVVPTMGALHEGHLSLIRLAAKKAHRVVVTLFVNPRQFGQNEDFKTYPRDEAGDLKKLKEHKVDYVFIPKAAAMYPKGFATNISVAGLSEILCGKSRPGHFDGVATVVLKLFNIVKPDIAVFGKKDYQQLVIIKRMVRDLNLPVKIVAAPIKREPDGLALSSRNTYLNPEERRLACCLSQGLKAVKRACLNGVQVVNEMKRAFLSQIPQDKRVRVDYIACLNKNDLSPLTHYHKGKTLVATAVFVGKTRLIDNIVI